MQKRINGPRSKCCSAAEPGSQSSVTPEPGSSHKDLLPLTSAPAALQSGVRSAGLLSGQGHYSFHGKRGR